jgi:hypothetical protein
VTASTLAGCNTLRNDSDTAPFHDGDWRSYGNGVRNANRVASGAPEPDEHQILSSGGWPYTPPVVHEDVVYFAADRQVTAVRTDGSERWSRDLEAEVSGTPTLYPVRGHLYVPTRIIRTSNSQDPVPASVTVLSLSDGDIVNIVDRRVGGIPGLLANVVECLISSHECGPFCVALPVATPDMSAAPTLATRRECIRKRR